jgi:hypothetical protein
VADFPALSISGATVLVRAPGMARYRVGWRDKKPALAVTLRPEAILSGEVLRPGGGLPEGFYVNLTSQGAGTVDTISASVGPDENGKFRITGIAAGKWSVQIRDAGSSGRSGMGTVELKEGQTTEWRFEWTK